MAARPGSKPASVGDPVPGDPDQFAAGFGRCGFGWRKWRDDLDPLLLLPEIDFAMHLEGVVRELGGHPVSRPSGEPERVVFVLTARRPRDLLELRIRESRDVVQQREAVFRLLSEVAEHRVRDEHGQPGRERIHVLLGETRPARSARLGRSGTRSRPARSPVLEGLPGIERTATPQAHARPPRRPRRGPAQGQPKRPVT